MLIPYFYFEVGNIKIFQPQNKRINFSKTAHINGEVFEVTSNVEPEIRGCYIFVNGKSASGRYHFLKLKDNSSEIIQAINFINRMYKNV